MSFSKKVYWDNRAKGVRGQGETVKPVFHEDHVRNRSLRRRLGGFGRGTPIDLGIKQYKREHGGETKRVLYFKEEMWKAFRELKGEQ